MINRPRRGGRRSVLVGALPPDEIARELNSKLQTKDSAKFCAAIEKALKTQNLSEIAREYQIDRTTLYRAFVRPRASFATVLTVLDALGLQVQVLPRASRARRRR
jgi:probable addiction module antidote protein